MPGSWRLLAALRGLLLERIPRDPLAPEFRQGTPPDDWPTLLAAAQVAAAEQRFGAATGEER